MLKWSTYHNITQASHPHLLPTIHLKREKQKTNISQLSAIVISEEGNSGNNTMEMYLHYNTCSIRRGRHHKHEEKDGPRSSAQRSSCLLI